VSRRQVRVDPTFFDRLDELLAPERGSDGTPSATDFLLHDLPAIIDLLAEDWSSPRSCRSWPSSPDEDTQ